ncbi:hypothetical protein OK016_18360 [Vibrio chagasii]|nr:hypothetical protein [Vibrio chagasii]
MRCENIFGEGQSDELCLMYIGDHEADTHFARNIKATWWRLKWLLLPRVTAVLNQKSGRLNPITSLVIFDDLWRSLANMRNQQVPSNSEIVGKNNDTERKWYWFLGSHAYLLILQKRTMNWRRISRLLAR